MPWPRSPTPRCARCSPTWPMRCGSTSAAPSRTSWCRSWTGSSSTPSKRPSSSATASHCVVGIVWRPQGDSNPCYRRERAHVSRALPCFAGCLCHFCVIEARGEIRGGRFVAGITGEQFALPEAVGSLRETRRAPPSPTWISLSTADPLNLIVALCQVRRFPPSPTIASSIVMARPPS